MENLLATLKDFWVTFKITAFVLGVIWAGRNGIDWYSDIERPPMPSESMHAMIKKGVLDPVYK